MKIQIKFRFGVSYFTLAIVKDISYFTLALVKDLINT